MPRASAEYRWWWAQTRPGVTPSIAAPAQPAWSSSIQVPSGSSTMAMRTPGRIWVGGVGIL